MKKFIIACLLFVGLVYPGIAQEFSANVKPFVSLQEKVFAITNVTLIDGTGKAPQYNMTVLVREGKIAEIGTTASVTLPNGSYTIDGKGKTLIPGFVMLHEHIFYTKIFEGEFNVVNMTNRMYLAGGVTTMRTGGSVSPHTDLNINRYIQEAKMIGPKMDVTGPFIERASNATIPQLPVLPADQMAGATVDYWATLGCTSFKVYMHISKEDLRQTVGRAHARSMKVTGHLCSITYEEAANIGIDNLEHGFRTCSDFIKGKIENDCDPFQMSTSLLKLDKDDQAMTRMMKILVDKGVSVTTTPAVFAPYSGYEMILGGGEESLHPDVLKSIRTGYDRQVGKDSNAVKMFTKELYWIKKFYDMGGKLVIGTDPTGAGRTVAGYANRWTFEILPKAGFTVSEAVMLCTLKGAEYLNRAKETGSIEKNKAADLILIDGDLVRDIGAIRKTQLVFKDGVGYDPKKIFESVKGKVGLY